MVECDTFPRQAIVLRRADVTRGDDTYILTRRVSFPTDAEYDYDYIYAVYRHKAGAESLRYATDAEIAHEMKRRVH